MIDWQEIRKERQEKYESKINEWNNTAMNYSEGALSFQGIVEIKTDDWGVKITLISEHYDQPISLSAAWSILSVGDNWMSASYVNWSLSLV